MRCFRERSPSASRGLARWLGAAEAGLGALYLLAGVPRFPAGEVGRWLRAARPYLVPPGGWTHTALLVVEGVAMLLAGIAARSRTLVVAGGAAIGVSGLRALFVLIENGLLFVAFGTVAFFLLGLGAALAILRERFQKGGEILRVAWRDWN